MADSGIGTSSGSSGGGNDAALSSLYSLGDNPGFSSVDRIIRSRSGMELARMRLSLIILVDESAVQSHPSKVDYDSAKKPQRVDQKSPALARVHRPRMPDEVPRQSPPLAASRQQRTAGSTTLDRPPGTRGGILTRKKPPRPQQESQGTATPPRPRFRF